VPAGGVRLGLPAAGLTFVAHSGQVAADRTANHSLMPAREPVRVPARAPDPHHDRKRVAPVPPPFDTVIERFNAGDYRACIEPLEVLFFADRNTFYQGLLHLTVALLQARLGMVRGPHIRLASAAALLAPYAPWHRGVEVSSLLGQIEAYRALLPEGVVQMPPEERERLQLPLPLLVLTPRHDPRQQARSSGDAGD
jgi:hypothetical protein